jgi:hypothetical protein
MTKRLSPKQQELLDLITNNPGITLLSNETVTAKSLVKRNLITIKNDLAYRIYRSPVEISGIVEIGPDGFYELKQLYNVLYAFRNKNIILRITEVE